MAFLLNFKVLLLLAFYYVSIFPNFAPAQLTKLVTTASVTKPEVKIEKAVAVKAEKKNTHLSAKVKKTVLFGQASYYANKFDGRKTANGEIFSQQKLTAACNSLPLGTWLKITNLRNHKVVILKTNDRLHPKTTRLVDLSKAAAQKLGFVKRGLTRVKVEVISKAEATNSPS